MSSFTDCPGTSCPTAAAHFDATCARRLYPSCDHLIDGLARFFNDGIRPGHFLTAVLTNDLHETFARADDITRAAIPKLMELLYNHAPAAAWGSHGHYVSWHGAKQFSRLIGEIRGDGA